MSDAAQPCDSILDFRVDRGTIRKSALDSIAIQLLFKLKGLVTMPIMTYFLLPREVGIFNLVVVTATVLSPLFSMNLTDGPAIYLVQEKSRVRIREMYDTVVNGVLLFCALFTVPFILLMRHYGGEYYRYVPIVLLLLYSTVAYKVASYLLAIFQKTAVLVRNTLVKDVSATVLTIALVVAGFSYDGMIFAVVFGNLLAAVLVYRIVRKDLPYRLRIDWEILSIFIRTSLPLLPVFFFSWIIQSSDSYFLAYFKDEAAVGKYSVVYGLTGVILALTYALNFFWFPVSARLWVDDREKYRKAFRLIFAAFAAALLVIVLLFELNSRAIMHLLVRKSEYHDAHAIMGIIAFAFALQVLITLLTAPLYANRNVKSILFCYLLGGATNVGLNFLLIPSTGIVGAAVSTAASYFVVVCVMALLSYKTAGFDFLDQRLGYVAAVFLAAWAGMYHLREGLGLLQALLANISIIGVAGSAFCYMILSRDERTYLLSMIKGAKAA